MRSKTLILLTFCSLSPFLAMAQTATTSTNTVSRVPEICTAINSLNIYSATNLKKIQTYIKQFYFPKMVTTGKNDTQTKYYIKKFQYAFGLQETGLLNEETINYLKKINNCFMLENKVIQIQNATVTKKITQDDLILDLIKNFFSSFFGVATSSVPSDVTVTAVPQ